MCELLYNWEKNLSFCRWDTQREVTVLIGMKKIGIMQNGGAAAVIKERRRRIAVPGSISAANIIILKHLIAIIWKADL